MLLVTNLVISYSYNTFDHFGSGIGGSFGKEGAFGHVGGVVGNGSGSSDHVSGGGHGKGCGFGDSGFGL